MSLFESLGNKPQPQQTNPLQALLQLKSNPANILAAKGFKIPEGMNDPRQIIQHLLQTGQINNQRLQMAQQMMSSFGGR